MAVERWKHGRKVLEVIASLWRPWKLSNSERVTSERRGAKPVSAVQAATEVSN